MKKIPIINDNLYLGDKDVDFRFYLASLLCSYHEGEEESNYLKFSTEWYIDEMEYFLKKMNVSEVTFEKNTNKFLISKVVIVDDGIIKIRVKNDNMKRYILAYEEEIKELLVLNSNEIKVYIAIRYLKSISKNKKVYLAKIEDITCLSTKTILKSLESLKKQGFITYESKKSKAIKDLKMVNTIVYEFKMPIFEKIKSEDTDEN